MKPRLANIISIIAVSLISNVGFATDSADEFCAEGFINQQAKEKVETMVHKKAIEQLGHVLTAEKDCKFIKDNYQKPGYILVDARDKATRQTTGTIPDTAFVVSDHKIAADHQWNEADIVKKLSSVAEQHGEKLASFADVKKQKLMLFCNGLKCYRSPWAACSLKKLGMSKENVYLILDGYDGLKQHCIK